MKINEIPFEPGTEVYEELKVAELHDGTWVNIPMAVMNGKEKGPTPGSGNFPGSGSVS